MKDMTPEKISEAGVYDISNELYHSDCCAGPSISPSSIKSILTDPSEYWRKSYLNPDRVEDEAKRAFNVGTAAHTRVLEPHRLAETISVVPEDYLATNGAMSTKKAKEFVAEQTKLGRTVITPDEWQSVCDIADNVRQNDLVMRTIEDGDIEKSLIYKDPETGIYMKARPDVIPRASGRFIVDLKTTDRDTVEAWDKSALADLRYDIQAAAMMVALRETTGIEAVGVMFVVTCKKPPNRVAVRVLRPNSEFGRTILDNAWLDVQQAVRTFSECWQSSHWPSPWDEVEDVTPPNWLLRNAVYRTENEAYQSPFSH